jgi:hypothetical protein
MQQASFTNTETAPRRNNEGIIDGNAEKRVDPPSKLLFNRLDN